MRGSAGTHAYQLQGGMRGSAATYAWTDRADPQVAAEIPPGGDWPEHAP